MNQNKLCNVKHQNNLFLFEYMIKLCTEEAGKLLLVDPADESCHHIFFDDNVERTHAHIVDCRDVSNNDAPINFEDVRFTNLS